MRALVYYGQRDISLIEIEKPAPGTGQVLVKVTDAGLCQTQINEFVEGPFIINVKPHSITGKAIPMIVGHQFGGIVEECGSGIKDKSVCGSQVAILPLISCGECSYCKKGKESMCENIVYYGLLGENGGFAEYVSVNEENIIRIKDRSLLTFIEPILVAMNSISMLKNDLTDKRICILGAGTIGLCVAAVLRDFYGVDSVINDILPERLDLAFQAGFTIIDKEQLKCEYDIVIEAAGSSQLSRQPAFLEGLGYLVKGGILLNIGTYFHPISIIPSSILLNQHQIYTSFGYNKKLIGELPSVLDKLKVDFSLFIEKISLENIIEEGYYRAEVDMGSFTRLVVVP